MSTYLIVSDAGRPDLDAAIKSKFDDAYHMNDRAWLVEAEETTQQLAEALEIRGEGEKKGKFGRTVVFLVTNWSGFHGRDLWEWLQTD